VGAIKPDKLGDKPVVAGYAEVVEGGVEGPGAIAGGELLPEGLEDALGCRRAGQVGETLADGGESTLAVVDFIVECIIQVENDGSYHTARNVLLSERPLLPRSRLVVSLMQMTIFFFEFAEKSISVG